MVMGYKRWRGLKMEIKKTTKTDDGVPKKVFVYGLFFISLFGLSVVLTVSLTRKSFYEREFTADYEREYITEAHKESDKVNRKRHKVNRRRYFTHPAARYDYSDPVNQRLSERIYKNGPGNIGNIWNTRRGFGF